MSRSRSSHSQPPFKTTGGLAASEQGRAPFQRAELWAELTRQRALLLVSSKASTTSDVEPEICADPTDQASLQLEQDLAMLVKVRTIAKLRRIERALQLIRTHGYGRCRRCQGDIPYERLKVQPDALFCVPCLSRNEKAAIPH